MRNDILDVGNTWGIALSYVATSKVLGSPGISAEAPQLRHILCAAKAKRAVRKVTLLGLFRYGIELMDSPSLHSPLVGEREMRSRRLDQMVAEARQVLAHVYRVKREYILLVQQVLE